MSQLCPRCGQPPYADQSMQIVQICHMDVGANVPTVTWACCPACAADLQGMVRPDRRTYGPGNWQFPVCGICRHALRLGEDPVPMRLDPQDIQGTEVERPGMYASCRECIARFAPVIFARLRVAGLIQHEAQMTADWLG